MSLLPRSKKYLGVFIWIIVYILCSDVSGEIIYIEEQTTWINAQKNCQSMNGNLINPNTVNKIKDSAQVIEDFWVGEVTTLSSWMDILGCYFIPSLSERREHLVKFKLVEPNPAICERLCQRYSSVFGLMGKECFCVTNMDVIPTLGKTKEPTMCNTTCKDFQVGLCGGEQRHYTIYTRRSSGQISNQFYEWTDGMKICYDEKEYLSSLHPGCTESTTLTWTSTFRDYATLTINEIPTDSVPNVKNTNTMCSSAKFTNQSIDYSRNRTCNKTLMNFFCEMDSNSTTQTKTGVILGTVIAFLLIAAGFVAVVFFLKSRSTKTNEATESKYESPVNSTEEGENSAYELANPIQNIKITTSKYKINSEKGYEVASISNDNKKSISLRKNPSTSKFTEINLKDTGYEFASIPNKSDYDDIYSDTEDGDYDLLNRKNDRNKKINNKEDTNFYSHTNDLDGTYDTTNIKSHECDVSDTYDHAKLSKLEVTVDDNENDPYNHTNQ